MKALMMVLVICLIPQAILAQFSITGKVVNGQTQMPLEGANVVIASSQVGTITDKAGLFELAHDKAGKVNLKISYVGYKTQIVQYLVTDQPSLLQITLLPVLEMEGIVIEGVRAKDLEPVSQSTIDRKDIETNYLGQDPVFLLESLSPSILAHSESGTQFANYSLIRMRGIDQTRINVTLNGIPLNDMIDQGVFFSNFSDFGNSIESVQLQRGVGTSTNGTASYAGSINFESIHLGEDQPGGEVQLTAGSFGTYRASGELKTGLMKNSLAFYSRYTKTLSDGYKFHSGTNSDSFFFSGGHFGEKELIKLTAFLGSTRNELAYLPVWIDDIRREPRTNYLDPDDEDDFGQQMVQLQYIKQINDRLSLSSSLYYAAAGGEFPFGFRDTTGALTQINYSLYNDHYGLMAFLDYESLGGLTLTGGFHLYQFDRINEENINPDRSNPYYSDDSRKRELSFFTKASYQTGQFNFLGDLQIRSVSLDLNPDLNFLQQQGVDPNSVAVPTRSWTFFNPKAGITYSFNPRFNFYGSFGRSGREPTRTDILGTSTINSFNLNVVSDEDAVKAEYVNDFELGGRFSGPKFTSKATFFYMSFENEITPVGVFIPEVFAQLTKNVSSSYRTGIELEWSWHLVEQLSFTGNTTFMKSKIQEFVDDNTAETVEDVVPILSPEWLINGTFTYNYRKLAELSLSGRYGSESFLELTNDPTLTMPSFFVTNLQISIQFLKNYTFTFQVNNIFDELYFTSGAPVDVDFDGFNDGPGYLVQPNRHFFGILKFRF